MDGRGGGPRRRSAGTGRLRHRPGGADPARAVAGRRRDTPARLERVEGRPISIAIGKTMNPITMHVVTRPIRPTIDQVSWKFRAASACARTTGDWLPLASSAISGATQPPAPPPTSIPAAPPKCAMSAHVLSSALGYPGGGAPVPGPPAGG